MPRTLTRRAEALVLSRLACVLEILAEMRDRVLSKEAGDESSFYSSDG